MKLINFVFSVGYISIWIYIVDADVTSNIDNDLVGRCEGFGGGYCKDDCSTLYICMGEKDPHYQLTCGVGASEHLPYCSLRQGKCVQSLDWDEQKECKLNKKPQPFYCTGEGNFFDPYNSSNYHVCSGIGTESDELYECGYGMIYNLSANTCIPKRNRHDNLVMNCNGKEGEFFSHPIFENTYGYCEKLPNGAVRPVIFNCRDINRMKYNRFVHGCEYACRDKGDIMENDRDCEGYIVCVDVHGDLVGKEFKCPNKYYFMDKKCQKYAADKQKCVNKQTSQSGQKPQTPNSSAEAPSKQPQQPSQSGESQQSQQPEKPEQAQQKPQRPPQNGPNLSPADPNNVFG